MSFAPAAQSVVPLDLSSSHPRSRSIVHSSRTQDHPDKVSPRIKMEFYDDSGSRIWKTHHECIMLGSFASYTMTETFHLFPSVASVKKIRFSYLGHHPDASKLDNAYRGMREIVVRGYT